MIGVGDYDIAPFFDPPLSSVGVSHKELAEQASQLLFRQLMGKSVPERFPCRLWKHCGHLRSTDICSVNGAQHLAIAFF